MQYRCTIQEDRASLHSITHSVHCNTFRSNMQVSEEMQRKADLCMLPCTGLLPNHVQIPHLAHASDVPPFWCVCSISIEMLACAAPLIPTGGLPGICLRRKAFKAFRTAPWSRYLPTGRRDALKLLLGCKCFGFNLCRPLRVAT